MSDAPRNPWTPFPRWLSRLLGPTEPELTCEECFAQLDRYVELEVGGFDAAAAVPGMKAHLEGCPACREEHDDLSTLIRSGQTEAAKTAPDESNEQSSG